MEERYLKRAKIQKAKEAWDIFTQNLMTDAGVVDRALSKLNPYFDCKKALNYLLASVHPTQNTSEQYKVADAVACLLASHELVSCLLFKDKIRERPQLVQLNKILDTQQQKKEAKVNSESPRLF